MSKRKCGVEPCPICKKTPLAIDTDLGFTIGCGNNNCEYYFTAKGRTLNQALFVWNKQTKRILKLYKCEEAENV